SGLRHERDGLHGAQLLPTLRHAAHDLRRQRLQAAHRGARHRGAIDGLRRGARRLRGLRRRRRPGLRRAATASGSGRADPDDARHARLFRDRAGRGAARAGAGRLTGALQEPALTLPILIAGVLVVAILAALAFLRARETNARDAAWQTLATKTPWQAPPFEPSMLDGLPEAARHYLAAAIRPGAPLLPTVQPELRGQVVSLP